MAPEPAPDQHGSTHQAEADAVSDRIDRTALRSVANPRRTRLL